MPEVDICQDIQLYLILMEVRGFYCLLEMNNENVTCLNSQAKLVASDLEH